MNLMIQGIHKHLSEETILLDLDAQLEVPEDLLDLSAKKKIAFKYSILEILVSLFDKTGKVVNPSKCLKDLYHRELKFSTGLEKNIAMPHVRTMQAKDLLIAFMRSEQGVYFDTLDKEPVHIFVGIVTPPYEDKKYLQVVSMFSKFALDGSLADTIMNAESPKDIMGQICRL